MKLWGLLKLFAGGGMLVVLGAAALMLWPLLWPPDPDASVQKVNGRLIGEATGYVGRIDRDAHTVDVSASLLGWRPIVLIVNEMTSILIESRQGGFGDLWKDMAVRVSYEVVGDARLARSIEVIAGDAEPLREVVSGAAPTPAPPPVATPSAAASPAQAAAPVSPAATSSAAASPAPSAAPVPAASRPPATAPSRGTAGSPPVVAQPPATGPTPAVTAPPAVAPRPAVEPPAARAVDQAPILPAPSPAPSSAPPKPATPPSVKPVPPVAQPRSVESAPALPPAARETPLAPSPTRPRGPAEGDAGDGAAVIDWLLRERSGR